MQYSVQRDIDGKQIILETGKFAEQASGAVTVRCGDTIVLATAVISQSPRPNMDFLPLTVDYEERLYARGKIPGSFFRREGRPSTEAILYGRLADRPIRPLFPKGFYNEVQVILTILSVDQENPPEILGIIGASAALSISNAPFEGPIGASRVAMVNGGYTVNPTYQDLNGARLNTIVAGTRDAIMMVESSSKEVSEEETLTAIEKAQEANVVIVDMIDELVSKAGVPKMQVASKTSDDDLLSAVNTILNGRMGQLLDAGSDKVQRENGMGDLETEVKERLKDDYSGDEISAAFDSILKDQVRSRILDRGQRPDGRGLKDIRPISCEVGVLPRTHGTGLFKRGQTQVLTVATLAGVGMRQMLDTLSPDEFKRYIHHYNFTPYSTGEVKRVGSPGRREVGHGALAERAVEVMMPDEEEFPYTIRLVSEVLSSNGSTSMASVCGSTLALMDAGVPIERPVAGVAMGLIKGEGDKYAVLTDIQGMEDHLGDMDFKVAGTSEGINALQMDIKVKGLTHDVLKDALAQAKVGRLFILDKMLEAISTPRETLSQYAPKMVRIMIPVDKIGTLIGPGGKTIRGMQEELGVTIDTQDSGAVTIGGSNQEAIERARDRIEGMTREITVGDIFTGKVSRITNFGVFVELIPGKDGLLRSEEMADTDEELNFGDEVTVMVKEIDHMGRTNLSRRALFGDATPRQSAEPSLRAPRPPGPRPGGPGFGPPRGGPGRGRPPSGPGGGPRRGGFGGGRPGGPSRQGPGQGFQR